jgi:hypothetical protein
MASVMWRKRTWLTGIEVRVSFESHSISRKLFVNHEKQLIIYLDGAGHHLGPQRRRKAPPHAGRNRVGAKTLGRARESAR